MAAMSDVPQIDTKKCKGCALCVEVCTGHGRAIVNSIAVIVRPDACVWCTLCEAVCPTGAANCPFDIVFLEDTPNP